MPAARAARLLLAALALAALPAAGAQVPAPNAVAVVLRPDPVTGAVEEVVRAPLDRPAVLAVQEALVRRGHREVALTGALDRPTRQALRELQVERGLRITGRPDAQTVRALGIPVIRVPDAARPGVLPRRPPTLIVIGPDADVVRPRDPAPIGVPPAGSSPPQSDGPAEPVPDGEGGRSAPQSTAAPPPAPGPDAADPGPLGRRERSDPARPRRARITPTLRRRRCRSSSS
jgi:hypothetical protein